MKRILIFVVLTLTILVGFMLYTQVVKPTLDNRTVATVVPMKIEATDLKFEFTYPSGESAYTLIEPPVPPETSDGLAKIYIMMKNEDYQAFSSESDLKETPPTVTVFVLKEIKDPNNLDEDRQSRLMKWAESNPQYTSYSLRNTEPEEVSIDGVKALRYTSSGNYESEVYLVSNRGNIYVLVGQYTEESDDGLIMLKDLINTVSFY